MSEETEDGSLSPFFTDGPVKRDTGKCTPPLCSFRTVPFALLLTFSAVSIYNRTCSARLCAGNALTTENPCVRKILTERVSPEEGHRESAVVRAGTGDGTEDHSRIAARTAAGGRLSSAPYKTARRRRISPLQEARMDPDRTVLSCSGEHAVYGWYSEGILCRSRSLRPFRQGRRLLLSRRHSK